jgi:hypothetical protein
MKKTLLSVIAGLAVIGSATAVPSMDVQQKNCEDGQHVWVEKTKTCVPINPCLSDDLDIQRAYCFPVDTNSGEIIYIDTHFPNETDLDMFIDKYVQTVLKTVAVEKIDLGRTGVIEGYNFDNGYREKAIGVKMADGGYFVIKYIIKSYDGPADVLAVASQAYGRYIFNSDGDRGIIYFAVGYMSEELCKDIVNFASRLSGGEKISFKSYDSENYRCIASRGS